MTVLITGGAGYIGSHICVELLASGRPVVVYDNFCNSHPEVINRISRVTGTTPTVVTGDVRDVDTLAATLSAHNCDAVIHLAGLKAVGESLSRASDYYDHNVLGSLRLAQAMQRTSVNKLVFSSSATVYGEPETLPLMEDHRLAPFSVYGRSKLMAEVMLEDIVHSASPLKVAILRYFNPIGNHESGWIGEDPNGIPNNLMPYISQVAVGRLPVLNVFGNDYPTPDGTGIRDYVHVVDLAIGHLRALDHLDAQGFFKMNLGTGRGTSVLELVASFATASGRDVPMKFQPRRPGDIASYYASVELSQHALNWSADRSIAQMCADAWRWQRLNPRGYTGS
jgi:UDP-glucose 4-epimerase